MPDKRDEMTSEILMPVEPKISAARNPRMRKTPPSTIKKADLRRQKRELFKDFGENDLRNILIAFVPSVVRFVVKKVFR